MAFASILPSRPRASTTRSTVLLAAMALAATAEPALAAAPTLPHNLTAWGMFMAADWVVKSVMIGLALASVATWTVLVAKSLELKKLVALHRTAFTQIDDARGLGDASRAVSTDAIAAAAFLSAARVEIQQSDGALDDVDGLKERIVSRLDRTETAAVRRMQRGTSILATIGSTAPFVGLFGTVWGIMNSFVGIAETQTTNLAVVAPGIAEALLATALGLVAAIPAVVIYNHFARQIAGYKALVGDTSAAVLRLVSRDASRGQVKPKMLQAAE
ncbi:tonB-system energizer ExbB [Sphingobium sp. AP50]|uniref:tonB-system energizer ExbB n=1 Tax=Sphingobium sp. AP50 TaxID=1884369 RepID=UPI001C432AF5|nr:tonB-system energizer ExbB [Sphingobium sp. AP50]